MRTLKPCGTVAAYKRHHKQGEKPCDPCREAHNEVKRQEYQRFQARPRAKVSCGTTTGYRRHHKNNEVPCQACRDAHCEYGRLYYRKRKTSENQPIPEYILLDDELVICNQCGYRELMFSVEEATKKAQNHKCV